mgnify:CR=1 FL=1
MSHFFRLLEESDKATALVEACAHLRAGKNDARHFEIEPELFDTVPGKPFSYWLTAGQLQAFGDFPSFEKAGHLACVTNQVGDDGRYFRAWWEVTVPTLEKLVWIPLAKGGKFGAFYQDVHLLVAWNQTRATYLGFVGTEHRPLEKPASADNFLRPGLTWPRRTQQFGIRVLPSGCIFSNKGPAVFVENNKPEELLSIAALMNSAAFKGLLAARLNAGDSTARSFEVGIIQTTPFPILDPTVCQAFADLSGRAWVLMRTLDTTDETSHAFLLPATLRGRLDNYDTPAIEAELARIQARIDAIAFDLYGFSETDRVAVQARQGAANEGETETNADEDSDEEESPAPIDQTAGLLSWAVGVAFGRFDWRLATGERAAQHEPAPFDPLPVKSPGMLPDGAEPFHTHAGILVDDQGHPHDLAHLVEEVLGRIDMPVPDDVRRWLQRDFFHFHLQRYSKSRRKAPIYWPLATASGSYTLWVFYPSLSSQTLYTAINDFVEPKLKEVGAGGTALRNKGIARTRDEEKQFETLQAFELELIELRDTLLAIAPSYQPNHDDGVQITAAPLWPLFRHKPWQNVLKDTRTKLEKGDHDWAHLAMSYWPVRVREKCKTDKSLAIAHDLEELYVEPAVKPKKTRGQSKKP